ncbi:MAG: DUF1905 domain-containing protein [Anaerolineales bacterium]|nr:DUF1905 domain-containing protein [Anaerolineales bacterium]
MDFEFTDTIFVWRGPSPYLFVTLPDQQSRQLQEVAGLVTYGWGVIPVIARLGATEWTTSLIPKQGRYLVPIRVSVQRAENVGAGDLVTLRLTIAPRGPARRGRPSPLRG